MSDLQSINPNDVIFSNVTTKVTRIIQTKYLIQKTVTKITQTPVSQEPNVNDQINEINKWIQNEKQEKKQKINEENKQNKKQNIMIVTNEIAPEIKKKIKKEPTEPKVIPLNEQIDLTEPQDVVFPDPANYYVEPQNVIILPDTNEIKEEVKQKVIVPEIKEEVNHIIQSEISNQETSLAESIKNISKYLIQSENYKKTLNSYDMLENSFRAFCPDGYNCVACKPRRELGDTGPLYILPTSENPCATCSAITKLENSADVKILYEKEKLLKYKFCPSCSVCPSRMFYIGVNSNNLIVKKS